jgi:hypothetical protein
VKPVGEPEKQRFATLVHWGYGTMWGGVRGLLDAVGLRGLAADSAHFGAVSATAMTLLPALKVAPPVNQWGGDEIAVESLHHMVYAMATGLTYTWLKANSTRKKSSCN